MLICAGTEIQTVKDKMKIPSGAGRQAPIHPAWEQGRQTALERAWGFKIKSPALSCHFQLGIWVK